VHPAAPRRAVTAPPSTVAPAAPPPGTTSLISIDREDGSANGPSARASISANGRWVAFESDAFELVPGDNNRAMDVFLRDRRTGETIRLPGPDGGPTGDQGFSGDPSISADGSTVAFVYKEDPGNDDVDDIPKVVAWSRSTGTSEVVSFLPEGDLAQPSGEPSVSGDGRFVAFSSTSLTGNEDETDDDVFVRDRQAGTTVLVSAALDGDPGEQRSGAPAISRNGRFVAFESDAGDLVAGDDNGETDVFVRDLAAARTELISVTIGGDATGGSEVPAISGDGRRVAFQSSASNLVSGAPSNRDAVYLRDRAAGATTLVSGGVENAPPNFEASEPAISDDGRIVAFAGGVTNPVGTVALVTQTEIYARETVIGETIRVSEALAGGPSGGQNVGPAIGGNGRYVAWTGNSPFLVDGDTNQVTDVFLRDLPPVPSLAPDQLDFGNRAIGVAGPPLAAILTNEGWGPVTGRGATRDGPAASDFEIVFDGCLDRTLHRTESCPVTVTFTPAGEEERLAVLQVAHDGPGSPATARLRGGGSQAVLELDPKVGAPGIVTVATGTGFPPNTEIVLTWSRGVTPTIRPITTDADGAFRSQILVFHNDVIGSRDLVVAPSDGTSFAPFGTVFLVTAAGSQPPRFIVVDPYGDRPPTLVMRR
jgi:Tol biopolymer transport system component